MVSLAILPWCYAEPESPVQKIMPLHLWYRVAQLVLLQEKKKIN